MGATTYGCVKLGAKHVTGVEGWAYRVERATEYFRRLGCRRESYSFVHADVLNYLPMVKPGTFDTILCFGFLYHTMRQVELFREIMRIAPAHLLIDTVVQPELTVKRAQGTNLLRRALGPVKRAVKRGLTSAGLIPPSTSTAQTADRGSKGGIPCLAFRHDRNRIEEKSVGPIGLVAYPTKSLIEIFLRQHGFDYRQLDWNINEIKHCDREAHLGVYVRGERVSYIATGPRAANVS
jgi:SAM-dependent methyltransferase